MSWIIATAIFIAGIFAGYIINRLINKNQNQHSSLKKDLDKSKYELEQYRQELVDHFARSAELLDNVSKDYSKLYEHMAKTSMELMPNLPTQDNPFAQRIATLEPVEGNEPIEDEVMDHQPRDYANGATGLFSGKPTAIEENETPQAEPHAKAS
ncbi:Z-ring associated protein ZapG [uncultured Photobacterium sp.]|uniref:Z-ring associated protein ZapG n=1 Tax=uncultured Photobacterium sp. TaxID=173973 RepID=UPI002622CF71|nr:Z-ring associated protein ZapG [uncultured Photobacterium sp.]